MKKSLYLLPCIFAPLYGQGSSSAPLPYSDSMQTIVMLGIAFIFFYFMIVRPEQKKRKEMESRRDSLSKGDRVIAMGIIGVVKDIKKESLLLKMADGQSTIEVLKSAVSEVLAEEK